ncbi:hypothetical protein PV749_36360 [Streptomyces sp. ID03-2B]|uniref:hypothetical protein n=1 Tax=Streptomyces sp. ID03-2B TaxID=3028660 RepID=UPI0029B53675|nr:hypothetical protein [Streptomyces sp. ID03-2B]MDX3596609.1 hypothetical protein [Streptomyces sp. ID03-2B]
MTNRRPLGTGPVPAVDDTPGAPPGGAVPRAVLAAERLEGAATAPPAGGATPAQHRPHHHRVTDGAHPTGPAGAAVGAGRGGEQGG